MKPDPKLLDDAFSALTLASEIVGQMGNNPNRDQIDYAQRAASAANAKLIEYQCQLRDAPRKEK